DSGRNRRYAWTALGRQSRAPGAAVRPTIALSMAYPAGTGTGVRLAARMASARFPDCQRPAARGMKRSLPYFKRHTLGAADRTSRPAGYGSNHHRYGEVKTRLTIDASDDFAQGKAPWVT